MCSIMLLINHSYCGTEFQQGTFRHVRDAITNIVTVPLHIDLNMLLVRSIGVSIILE